MPSVFVSHYSVQQSMLRYLDCTHEISNREKLFTLRQTNLAVYFWNRSKSIACIWIFL